MNKKQKIYLFGSALLVAVGVTIYFLTKDDDDEDKDDENIREEKEQLKVEEPVVAKKPTNTFPDKVRVLQALLGFTGDWVDGDIGTETRKRLVDNGITTTVTPANIDSITAKLKADLAAKSKAEQEKVAKNLEIQKTKNLNDSRLKQANLIISALKKNNKLTWLGETETKKTYKKDLLGKYIPLSTKKIDKNDVIIPKSTTTTYDGFLIVKIGDYYLFLSPWTVTVF